MTMQLKREKKFAIEASKVKTFGTLDEICSSFDTNINEIKAKMVFLPSKSTLVVDIDKTICESPAAMTTANVNQLKCLFKVKRRECAVLI